MFKRIALLLAVLFSVPSPGHADWVEMAGIFVTASKWDESEAEVTQDITVITRAEIEKRVVPFVVDLLRNQPDLNLVQRGGFGKNATIFLRGGGGNQTLVLVDGVKINSPSTGSADLSGLLGDDVERIEILKGPQSTMYGSEAMAGVVNIITKKGAGKLEAGLLAEGGSFSTARLSGSLSGGTKKWNYRLTPSFFSTSGISAAASGAEPDGYTEGAVSARMSFAPSSNSSIDLNLRYSRDRSDLDGFQSGGGTTDDSNWVQKKDSYLVSAKGGISPSGNYGQTLLLSYAGERLKSEDPDTSWNNSRINTEIYNVDWQHILRFADLRLTGGFSFREEAAENVGEFDRSANNRAGYLDGKFMLLDDALIIEAGARYDAHESFGEAVTYRTGLLYHMKLWGIRLKGNHGTGFRAPSLNELYYPFYGNENLKAERCAEFDAGIEKEFAAGRFTMGATWFRQRYRDLIQTNFATFTADNIGRARVEGVEANLAARPLESISLKAAYTYMDAVDLDTEKILSRRPRNKVVVSAYYSGKNLALGGDYIFVSRRFDSSADRELPSYSLVNLRGSYAVRKYLTIFARVENLFDKDYQEAGGFGTPGIAAYGGVRVEF